MCFSRASKAALNEGRDIRHTRSVTYVLLSLPKSFAGKIYRRSDGRQGIDGQNSAFLACITVWISSFISIGTSVRNLAALAISDSIEVRLIGGNSLEKGAGVNDWRLRLHGRLGTAIGNDDYFSGPSSDPHTMEPAALTSYSHELGRVRNAVKYRALDMWRLACIPI